MIPISSKVDKYKRQYQHPIDKYGICDNISFGYILGRECAILLQNLFPVTQKYIDNMYIDKHTHCPIVFSKDLSVELHKKARKKIRYNQKGKAFGMTDVMKIYNELIKDVD